MPSTVCLRTSSRVVFIIVSMCRSLVEMKMWMYGTSHLRALSMSSFRGRARATIWASSPRAAIFSTDSVSPSEVMGNPASIFGTLSSSSCWAIRIFSSIVYVTPGICSPSLRVVSNIHTLSGA